jgi:tetratricopeptide (TPR) repeat protein
MVHPPQTGRLGLGCALILLASFLAFGPALGGDFVWDDDTHLLDNPVFDETGLYGVWLSPPTRINYWPVTYTTYWLEHGLWGFDPLGYHVVNVVLHALACMLLWRLLAVLGVPFAWLAALVFAVHPVNVESVAWIAQRKNILSLLFFFLTLIFYLEAAARRDMRIYGLAVASFFLSMFSKGAAAPLPAVLLLACWQRGRITRRDVVLTLPFFGIALLASLLEISTQLMVADEGALSVRDDGLLARLAGSAWVWWFYLAKALVPLGLNFVYPRWQIDASQLVAWLPLLGVAVVYLLALRWRVPAARPVLFALLYFGLMLSPVLGFFNIYYMRYSYVADHYQYLALPGVVALVVGGAGHLCGRGAVLQQRAFLVGAGILVVLFVVTSATLSGRYRDEETLWRATLTRNPGAFLASYNLAHLMQSQGRLDEAVSYYQESLRADPGYAGAHNNLGRIAEQRGQIEAANAHYHAAITADPRHADSHNNLAALYDRQGDVVSAERHFLLALEYAPRSVTILYNLGYLLERTQRTDAALELYRRALEIDPAAEFVRAARARAAAHSTPHSAP